MGRPAAEHRKVSGVHFIRVRGDAAERARGHAALLKNEVRAGALQALAKKNEWLIRKGPGLIRFAPVQAAAVWFYHRVLIPWLARQSKPENVSVMRAMARETGLPPEVFIRSLFQADGLMVLSRLSLMKYLLKDLPQGGMPGCSSAVVLGDWTRDGRLLVCRNQDYPVVGHWESNTTVIFSEPTEPDSLPHVSVTTAGVHTAGLTSMNAEGITLNTHAHFGKNIRLAGGNPVISIGNEIVKRARTLGEAVDIARKNPPYANWAFVMSSAKERDAVVIETTPRRLEVRQAEDGFIAHSNYFHTPDLQADEALISGGVVEDLYARVCRLREKLTENRGRLEPSHLVDALADHFDSVSGEERVFGNTVSVVTTIKSVVFEPEAGRMWVSSRQETPTGLGEFLGFDVGTFWEQGNVQRLEPSPKDPSLLEAIRHHREAYRSWHMLCHEPDYRERALISLRRATRAYPSDGNLWVLTGIVAFRMSLFEEAMESLLEAGKRKLGPHIEGVRRLFLARCHDLAGERKRALSLYAAWREVPDPKLRQAFRRGNAKPYRKGEVHQLLVDLQFPDTLQY